jgi:hypothetical protein
MPMQTSPHTTQVLQPNAQLSPGVRELFVTAWGMTDRGRVRSTNEDQFVIAALTGTLWVQQSSLPQPRVRCGEPTGHLFVVADGIGGHGGGARASALAVEVVEKLALGALGRLFMPAGGPSSFASDLGPSDELEHAVREADATVRTEASEDASLSQMGTTLTLAYSLGDQLYVAHVGDSRCRRAPVDRQLLALRQASWIESMNLTATGKEVRHLAVVLDLLALVRPDRRGQDDEIETGGFFDVAATSCCERGLMPEAEASSRRTPRARCPRARARRSTKINRS